MRENNDMHPYLNEASLTNRDSDPCGIVDLPCRESTRLTSWVDLRIDVDALVARLAASALQISKSLIVPVGKTRLVEATDGEEIGGLP